MYLLENRINFIKTIMLVAIVILSIKVIFKLIIENKVIENRENYQMFDNCYHIKNNYYCEKN